MSNDWMDEDLERGLREWRGELHSVAVRTTAHGPLVFERRYYEGEEVFVDDAFLAGLEAFHQRQRQQQEQELWVESSMGGTTHVNPPNPFPPDSQEHQAVERMLSHDWTYNYTDDGRVYDAGRRSEISLYSFLGKLPKETVRELWATYVPKYGEAPIVSCPF